MKRNKEISAQGTIEYLVVIAVVVVVSLVVVGLLGDQMGGASAVSTNSSEIGLRTGSISIIDSVASSDSGGLISLQNNTGDSLTVEKVVVDGTNHVFSSNPSMQIGERLNLDLNGITACTGSDKKNYSVKIVYTSSSGLEKVLDLGTIAIDCVPKIIPKGEVVKENTSSDENQTGNIEDCTYIYSDWADCNSDSLQTRTIESSSPEECVGTPELTQSCEYISPSNSCEYVYSSWSDCNSDGLKSRTVESSTPEGCTGTPVTMETCVSNPANLLSKSYFFDYGWSITFFPIYLGSGIYGDGNTYHWNAVGSYLESPAILDASGTETTGISVTSTNLGGMWANPFCALNDNMLKTYAYGNSEVQITITGLPANDYDIVIYSAPWDDPAYLAEYDLSVGGENQGAKYIDGTYGGSSAAWIEGTQYVQFRNITVQESENMIITIPTAHGYALLSGLQIVPLS